jgi:CheY-like chemotaxis protein
MTWRILVVDDDESVAFFTRESLLELGTAYHVEMASSGEEAWRKIRARPYDIVIADLRMQGMDGLELLSRTRRGYPRTQLVLMTAYGNDGVRAAARQLQVCRCIAKPFQMEELIDAIRSITRDSLERSAIAPALKAGHSGVMELPDEE